MHLQKMLIVEFEFVFGVVVLVGHLPYAVVRPMIPTFQQRNQQQQLMVRD